MLVATRPQQGSGRGRDPLLPAVVVVTRTKPDGTNSALSRGSMQSELDVGASTGSRGEVLGEGVVVDGELRATSRALGAERSAWPRTRRGRDGLATGLVRGVAVAGDVDVASAERTGGGDGATAAQLRDEAMARSWVASVWSCSVTSTASSSAR